MRPPVFSALGKIVVAMGLLATACTAETTVGAEQPAAEEQEPARGSAVDPLPTATPTVVPASPPTKAGDEAGQVSTADNDVLGERFGIPSVVDRSPLYSGPLAVLPTADVVPVDYTVQPQVSTLKTPSPSDGNVPIIARGITPSGDHAWVAIPDPAGEPTCPDGRRGTRLGLTPLDGSAQPRLAQPTAELPPNIIEVHYGPEGHALLYASCADYIYPVAFAKIAANDEFTDIRLLDTALAAISTAYPPRWIWGRGPGQSPFEDIGDLIAVIPQQGITAPGDTRMRSADIYISVTENHVVDVFPNDEYLVPTPHAIAASWDGTNLAVDHTLPQWTGTVLALETQRGFGPAQAAAGGSQGAFLFDAARWPATEVQATRLRDRAVFDLDWSPTSDWVAVTGADGTTLHQGATTIDVSSERGDFVYFNPTGSAIVVFSRQGSTTYTFPSSRPSGPTALSPFSQLDSGGIGPIRVGMSVSELTEKLGIEATIDGIEGVEVGYCVWVNAPALTNISMLAEATTETDAVITSITVWSGPWQTPSGLRLGSTENEVLETLEGNIDAGPRAYTAGTFLDFLPTDPADPNGVRFVTNGHDVEYITVGLQNWITLIEGCA